MNKDQFYGAMIGSACGDTLGRACEFMTENQIIENYNIPVKEFMPDPWNQFNFGEYTDDTALMMCIARSLIEKQDYNLYDISQKFIHWLDTDGRDCGNQTFSSISLMKDGFEPLDSGKHAWEKTGKKSASNGSLMRNTPIPLFFCNNFDKMLEATELIGKTTHYDNKCVLACLAHSIAMYAILHDKNIFDYVWAYCGDRDNNFDDLLYEARDKEIEDFKLDGSNQGYVYLSLKVALCAVLNYDNFHEPIIKIVNKGGDSDTNACIAGSLLGAKYGLNSIPKSWQDNLMGFSDIYNVTTEIYNLSNS